MIIKRKFLSIIVSIFCLAVLSTQVSSHESVGPIDGVWTDDNGLFVSVHDRNGSVLILPLDASNSTFEAGSGTRIGNVAIIEMVYSPWVYAARLRVTLLSSTRAIATLISCTPYVGYSQNCPPLGTTTNYRKFW